MASEIEVTDSELTELCGGLHHLRQLGIPEELFREMVTWRRSLHRCPELAFHEFETAKFLHRELAKIDGVEVLDEPCGGETGILALIEGTKAVDFRGSSKTKTILFRADMDALPITETTEASSSSSSSGAAAAEVCCAMCGGPNAPPWQYMVNKAKGAAAGAKFAQKRNVPKRVLSAIEGKSHACGHDGHMAMLLGSAKVLAKRRAELAGRVVLLFQPAEERHPVGNPMGGAIRMIRDVEGGAALKARLDLDRLNVNGRATNGRSISKRVKRQPYDAETVKARDETDGFDTSMDGPLLDAIDEVYGAHLWNYASAGTIGCHNGPVTANSDSVMLVVRGTGGHASAPQGTVDAVVVAAQLISALQMLVSRNVSPTESAVLTLGKIDGGFAPNVIATEVRIAGTMRTFNAPVKALMTRRIHEIAAGIAASHGPKCSIEVLLRDGYPACVNEAECAAAVLSAAEAALGQSRLVGPPTPNMAGEDFTFFLSRKPGAFFFVGSNPHAPFVMDKAAPTEEAEAVHGDRHVVAHHTPEFDLHEGSLAVGAATWVALALQRLA